MEKLQYGNGRASHLLFLNHARAEHKTDTLNCLKCNFPFRSALEQ